MATDATEQAEQERQERQAHQLEAAMTDPQPPPPLPPTRRLSSKLSAGSEITEVLDLLVTRIDQVARLNQEQWQRSESVLVQMQSTMKLAQVMIGQQDQQQALLRDNLDRLEASVEALIKINANLSEIMAELLGNGPAA